MSETQPLLRIPDQAYGARGIPVPQGAFELHQPEQGPVNGPLPLEAKDLAKHALAPDTPEIFIHGPINIFPGEVAARRVAAAVGGALRRFPQAVLDSASVTLFGAPSAVDVNDPRLGRVVTTGAAAFALAACATGAAQPPTRSVEVTRAAVATAIPPTETPPPTATFTAIPPTPTVEASRTPAPRPTPDKSISSVKLEANISMAQELTKTAAGQVLLNRIDDLAKEIGSTRANVLANLDVSYSTDPATGEIKYAFANVKPGGGFGALSQTQGLDTGAFVAGDLKFESKQEDLLNNQYPKMDVDGKRLIVSTGLASSVAGVHVKEVKPDVFKRKFVAYGDDGSIVAEASMDINSSPVKSKEKGSEGKPLPDWKAVWSVLPNPTAVAGITGTPGSSGGPEPKPTTQAPAEKTPTATATRIAETVKPTGAYKEVNGSIVWTSFENAKDTITPPTILGLKAKLNGEKVVYVDAAGKEVGEFNPLLTYTENGVTKRLGGVALDANLVLEMQKLKGNERKIALPINVSRVGDIARANTGIKNPTLLIQITNQTSMNDLFKPYWSNTTIQNGSATTLSYSDTGNRLYKLTIPLGQPKSSPIPLGQAELMSYEAALAGLNGLNPSQQLLFPNIPNIGKYSAMLYYYDLIDGGKEGNSIDAFLSIPGANTTLISVR